MNDLTKFTDALQMTSREIAELTGKQHKHVLRDLDALVENLNENNGPELGLGFSMTYEGDPAHGYRVYVLDRDATLCLVTGYDATSRMRIIKRWQELELQNSQQQAALDQEQQALALWQHDRARAASGYRTMMRLMEEELAYLSPEDLIKEKVREAEFLNYLIVGMSSRYFKYWFKTDSVRDELTYVQIEAFNETQTLNASLMAAGVAQNERHLLVEAFFDKKFPACKAYRDQTNELLHYRLDSKQYHLKPTHPRESPLLNPAKRLGCS